MPFNIIGAGKLGLALAQVLTGSGQTSLGAICNRSYASAIRSCEIVGFGQPVAQLCHLPAAEITFITVNDDQIPSVVDALGKAEVLTPGSLVFHCSGLLGSEVLAPLQQLGCFVASLHPLKAFRANDPHPSFANIYCTLEGNEEACAWAKVMFDSLGAEVLQIASNNKAAYHAAACMASNYLITLAASCETLFLQAGLSQETAMAIIQNQMQGALDNLKQTGNMKAALTGPLLRGDSGTIALHVQTIQDAAIKAFYQAAGLATLPLTTLPLEKKQAISNLLTVEE